MATKRVHTSPVSAGVPLSWASGSAPGLDELIEVFARSVGLELLAEHIGQHRPGEDRSRWLFEATAGLPSHQNTVGHQWRKACIRAKVVGFTLHDLRHFYASGLIAAGCDVVTVQQALGHAKATTTLNGPGTARKAVNSP